MEPSLLTLLSIMGLIITIADYLVPQSLIVNQAYLNHSQIYYQVKKTPDYLA